MKKVEYMESRIGNEYEGVISGITNYGLYVELPNTVEGMVHVTTLRGDYYNYVEDTYEMVGENTGKSYKLGQTVKIVSSARTSWCAESILNWWNLKNRKI